jgi:hypothetical protein
MLWSKVLRSGNVTAIAVLMSGHLKENSEMGLEFFQSQMGHKFYMADVPRIINALEKIVKEFERYNNPVDEIKEIDTSLTPPNLGYEIIKSLAEAAQDVLNNEPPGIIRLEHLETETVRAFDYLEKKGFNNAR